MRVWRQKNTVEKVRHIPAFVIALAASFVGACQSKDVLQDNLGDGRESKAATVILPPTLIGNEAAIIADINAAAQTKAESSKAKSLAAAALQKVLFDPESVRFLDLRMGKGGAVCGKYNAKNRYGAYVGFRDFVVTSGGYSVTSDSNNGIEGLQSNYFATAYLGACASAKERSDYLAATNHPADDSGPSVPVDDLPTPSQNQEPDKILDAPLRSAPVEDETT